MTRPTSPLGICARVCAMAHGGRWVVDDVSAVEVHVRRGDDTIRVTLDRTTRTVYCAAAPHLEHIARDMRSMLQGPALLDAQDRHAARVGRC